VDPECSAAGSSVKDRVLCFPYGRGSTVGSYSMYQLKLNGVAPRAIVNESAEAIVATGAIMSETPMVDGVDVSLIRTGDDVVVDAGKGTVELRNVVERHVVTSIMRSRGRILILKRSDRVGSYRGEWAGVSGFIESGETDEEAARREVAEELGVKRTRMVRGAPSKSFRHDDVVWTVHPFLFDIDRRNITTDWEHDTYEWILPSEVKRYRTVPGLEAVITSLLDGPSP